MISGINELKTLTKHISYECQCIFDRRKNNLDQWWNNDKCQCECKECHVCEKDNLATWNPATCSFENGKYLASIMNDLAITCDAMTESYHEEKKAIPTNFKENKAICKIQNFYILLGFLLSTIELLIAFI